MRIAACVYIYLIDAEGLLAFVFECELGINCLTFLYLAERECAGLEFRTWSILSFRFREIAEIVFCECPYADLVLSLVADISLAVDYRSRPVGVLAPKVLVGCYSECHFGCAVCRNRIRRDLDVQILIHIPEGDCDGR